jgi:hypothetical protein
MSEHSKMEFGPWELLPDVGEVVLVVVGAIARPTHRLTLWTQRRILDCMPCVRVAYADRVSIVASLIIETAASKTWREGKTNPHLFRLGDKKAIKKACHLGLGKESS